MIIYTNKYYAITVRIRRCCGK